MFSRNSNEPHEDTDLQKAIAEAISGFKGMEDGTEASVRAATAVKLLMEARAIEVEKIDETSAWRPSADTVVTVLGSLAGIVAILGFEKANVITSKALTFAIKPKI